MGEYRHIEAIQALYSTVTFHFVHLNSAYHFLSTLPRIQRDSIRSVHLSWNINTRFLYNKCSFVGEPDSHLPLSEYREAFAIEKNWAFVCQALASLPYLSDLHVMFYNNHRISESRLLSPLQQITKPDNFLVDIPWQLKDSLDPLEGNLLFQLCRKPETKVQYAYVVAGTVN